MEHILIAKALLTRRKRSVLDNEETKNKYHSVGKVLKSNIKIVERGKIDTLTQK
jgi:hypothetical protein